MNKVKSCITVFIILVLGYLFFANINHIFYVNTKFDYDFSKGVEVQGIKDKREKLKSDLELIDGENISLSKETKEKLKKIINDALNTANKLEYLNYTDLHNNLKQTDLIKIINNSYEINTISLIDVYNELATDNQVMTKNKKAYTERVYLIALVSKNLYEELYNNYKYNTVANKGYKAETVFELYLEKLNMISYIDDLVLERSESNE